ncbi:DUF4936 family protein [Mitsuaria sp. GD03876]|uniref:DUF4936 family protein n=1 Tax=Mitsuaria sp. GD03876 TaxID=2975399 RepID=UPI0024483986|nr:DUF4936 family protein [Mitsuaria sp. GD03876]MDH0867702.1 DUF4936 family protein [Mitsuaria sp. GD03876]
MTASPPTRTAAAPPDRSTGAPVELYVYYRVHTDHLAAALAAFEQARDARPVRLLRRHDNDPVFQTWMEIYGPELPDAADAERGIAAALATFAQGPRHREAFAALAGPGAAR